MEGEGRERPTRSGRENAVEGGHWPMGAAVAFSWPPAAKGVCGRSRGAIGFAQSTVVRGLEDWYVGEGVDEGVGEGVPLTLGIKTWG